MAEATMLTPMLQATAEVERHQTLQMIQAVGVSSSVFDFSQWLTFHATAMTFIFARGTGELGNMGSVVGPPTASALQQLLGANGVSVQGVDYPADAAGNCQCYSVAVISSGRG